MNIIIITIPTLVAMHTEQSIKFEKFNIIINNSISLQALALNLWLIKIVGDSINRKG